MRQNNTLSTTIQRQTRQFSGGFVRGTGYFAAPAQPWQDALPQLPQSFCENFCDILVSLQLLTATKTDRPIRLHFIGYQNAAVFQAAKDFLKQTGALGKEQVLKGLRWRTFLKVVSPCQKGISMLDFLMPLAEASGRPKS